MGRSFSRLAALVVCVVVAVLAGGTSVVAKPNPPKPDKKAVPGELIVRFAAGVSEDARREVLRSIGAKEVGKADRLRLKFAHVDEAAVLDAIKRLEDDRRVDYAEPNFVLAADRTPGRSVVRPALGAPQHRPDGQRHDRHRRRGHRRGRGVGRDDRQHGRRSP